MGIFRITFTKKGSLHTKNKSLPLISSITSMSYPSVKTLLFNLAVRLLLLEMMKFIFLRDSCLINALMTTTFFMKKLLLINALIK